MLYLPLTLHANQQKRLENTTLQQLRSVIRQIAYKLHELHLIDVVIKN